MSVSQKDVAKTIEDYFVNTYAPSMSLLVNKQMNSVTLQTTTEHAVFGETCMNPDGTFYTLLKSNVTGCVIGIDLPILRDNLTVMHQGPMRVNCGFRKDELV